MKKEILSSIMSGSMLFGAAGATAVEAQTEQEAEVTPSPTVEVIEVQLDVSPMIEGLQERVDFSAEPHFFNKMLRKADKHPNDFFIREETGPNQTTWTYSPEGNGTPIRAAYLHSVGFLTGNERNGVPSQVPYTVEIQDWYLDVGQNGTLQDENDNDLFNYKRMENITEEYFREPKVLKDMEWTRLGHMGPSMFSKDRPAVVQKMWRDNEEIIEGYPSLSEGWFMSGNQDGFLHLSHYERTIPSLEGGE